MMYDQLLWETIDRDLTVSRVIQVLKLLYYLPDLTKAVLTKENRVSYDQTGHFW